MKQRFRISTTKEFQKNLIELPKAVSQRADRAAWKMVNNPWAKELHPEKIKNADTYFLPNKAHLLW